MKFKAVLFDFDYTLGDATDIITQGFCYAFACMGLPRPEREAVRRTIGYHLTDAYTRLTGDTDSARRPRFAELFREKANPLQITGTRLFPGALELLSALKVAGVRTGVVSTKRTETLEGVLAHHGAAGCFDLIIGGDLVSRPKPDPEGLNIALTRLGLIPEQVLYCGDTVLDAGAARHAGTCFCAVLNGTTPAEEFAPYPCLHIAPDLPELKAWLEL